MTGRHLVRRRSVVPLPQDGIVRTDAGTVQTPIERPTGLTMEASAGHVRAMLPRKEVIQPQLPLRLPCYDFVPVTNPTLGGCAPEGFTHRLQVLPAPMT